jgi:hypothetical protein
MKTLTLIAALLSDLEVCNSLAIDRARELIVLCGDNPNAQIFPVTVEPIQE